MEALFLISDPRLAIYLGKNRPRKSKIKITCTKATLINGLLKPLLRKIASM